MKARRRKGGGPEGGAGASHCAGARGSGGGGAVGQLCRGGLREGPSFGEAGSDQVTSEEVWSWGGAPQRGWGVGGPPPRRRTQGKVGSGGAISQEAGSERRGLGKQGLEGACWEGALQRRRRALRRRWEALSKL